MANRNKRKVQPTMSGAQENVPNVPEHTPVPGVGDSNVSEQPIDVEVPNDDEVPSESETEDGDGVIIEEEQPKAKRSSGIRKVSAEEHNYLTTMGNNCFADDDPWDKAITYAELPAELQNFTEINRLIARGLVTSVMEGPTLVSIAFTDIGYEFSSLSAEEAVSGKVTKAKGTSTAATGDNRMKYNDPHYRIVRLTSSNPRRADSHGFYSWQLYRDGMTYKEYVESDYNKDQDILGTETKFNGPSSLQFKWDLEHGFIAVYDDRLEETDPNYWVARYPSKERAVKETTVKAKGKKGKKVAPTPAAENLIEVDAVEDAAPGQEDDVVVVIPEEQETVPVETKPAA